MSKRKTILLALSGVVAGLTFGFISPAMAGLAADRPVRVWINSYGYPQADGSFTTARYGALNSYISCEFQVAANYIECSAREATEGPTSKFMTCLVNNPNARWLHAFASLNRNSYLTVLGGAGGICSTIAVWNGSQFY